MTLARIALTLAVAGVAARLYLNARRRSGAAMAILPMAGRRPRGRATLARAVGGAAERPSTENAPAHGFAETPGHGDGQAKRRPAAT